MPGEREHVSVLIFHRGLGNLELVLGCRCSLGSEGNAVESECHVRGLESTVVVELELKVAGELVGNVLHAVNFACASNLRGQVENRVHRVRGNDLTLREVDAGFLTRIVESANLVGAGSGDRQTCDLIRIAGQVYGLDNVVPIFQQFGSGEAG